jgi:RecB family endonuclease NucS
MPDGEMGRRIFVRWDMTVGPDNREMVVSLPEDVRFTPGEVRPTLSEIKSVSFAKLTTAMNDQANWVGLWSHFAYERALSGYIAAYPHRLEDGLLPHPNEKVRERVFRDQSRLDVILLDRDGTPVIVECKQGQPTIRDLKQIRQYIRNLQKETRKHARGILVHGGAKKLLREVRDAAKAKPKIEIIQYKLDVDFTPCN